MEGIKSEQSNWRKKLCLLLFVLMVSAGGGRLFAQDDVAIKTNLAYDALATVNAGVEIGLAPKWTLDISGNYNGWTVNEHKWKHWLVQPEARYWFCDRFVGHFIGAHLLGGQYNVGHIDKALPLSFLGSKTDRLKDYRFQGYGVGVGVAYGYAFVLGLHWNLELELGLGYIYTKYDKFECKDCGKKVADNVPHHYVGPTKAAVNLVYLF